MNDKTKGYFVFVIFLIVLAGLSGLISGEGFAGGIAKEANETGEAISILIKIAIVCGVIWLVVELLKDKTKK